MLGDNLSVATVFMLVFGWLFPQKTLNPTYNHTQNLYAAFKGGLLAKSKVLSCRVYPQRPEPNAGVISHSGTDIYVAMLNAAAQVSPHPICIPTYIFTPCTGL